MKNNRYKDLQLFVEVVEKGGITPAAKQLELSKSVVSRSISQLEESWGAQLLYRSTRSITLTEVGEIVYQHCKNVLFNLSETADIINESQTEIRGLINITVPDAFSSLVLADYLYDFMKIHPALKINVHISGKRVNIISEGIDLAIRIGVPQDSDLKIRKLATSYVRMFCSPEFLKQNKKKLNSLSDLGKVNCLAYSDLAEPSRWSLINSETNLSESVSVNSNLFSDNDLFLISMALKGQGVIMCPSILVKNYLDQGKLVPVLEKYSYATDIFILHNFSNHMPKKYRAFIDYLSSNFQLQE
jgi:DNA-binding transcriptional LysR family regulator